MREHIHLLGAGSLRAVLSEIAAAFEKRDGSAEIVSDFAASGTLRSEIEAGRACDVFASANMAHPARLHDIGLMSPPGVFCRNRLVALFRRRFAYDPDALIDCLLSPDVRVGTSTPGYDPSGDYADALFERAEKVRPGAARVLKEKALRLTGAPDCLKPADGGNLYAWVLTGDRCDIFLTYLTNALRACEEQPDCVWAEVPETLAVSADYGLSVGNDAPIAAHRFAGYVLSTDGQAVLRQHGFAAGDTRQGAE